MVVALVCVECVPRFEPVSAELAPAATDPWEPGGGAGPAVSVKDGGGRTGTDSGYGSNTWLHSCIVEASIPYWAFHPSCTCVSLVRYAELLSSELDSSGSSSHHDLRMPLYNRCTRISRHYVVFHIRICAFVTQFCC